MLDFALIALPEQFDIDPPAYAFDDDILRLINRLRFHAVACRASAYLDIHEACRMSGPLAGQDPAARILIRVLGQVLGRRPVWHRPGAATLSFDEAWLAQVIRAHRDDDADSYVFLTTRRIAPEKRRLFAMLLHNLTTHFWRAAA